MTKLVSIALCLSALGACKKSESSTDNPAPAATDKAAGREERMKEREAELDTNHDGVVSEDERAAGMKKRAEMMRQKLDTNSDGKLTPDELAAAKGRMKFDDPAALDTNHDGDISVDELQAAMKARWDKWHANGGSGAPDTK